MPEDAGLLEAPIVILSERSAGMKNNSHRILRFQYATKARTGIRKRRNKDTPVWLCSFLRG